MIIIQKDVEEFFNNEQSKLVKYLESTIWVPMVTFRQELEA